MPIFSLIASALAATEFFTTLGIGASTISGVLLGATAIGLNYVLQSLSQNSTAQPDNVGVQLSLQAGGDLPRTFGLGYHVTSGSLVYANTWGTLGETPNAFLTQVIALSDLPGEQLVGLWVNGELVTIDTSITYPGGHPVIQYRVAGADYLFIKYYDGTQSTADSMLTGSVSSAARPYQSTRVGTGVCYVICTSLVNDKLFTGIPTFKFELSGLKLYDPTRDTSAGGSGTHDYSNPATWGGDGDQFPAVQIYNLLRGIRYNGAWVCGLQNMSAARLPSANWRAQIDKCRATITGESGLEPTYRSGAQVGFDAQPANAVEAFLTACQGRLCEIGGFYKLYVGAPDSSAFVWTDADLLSTEEQEFRPFFSLSNSVNGIQGSYPDPAQGWEMVTAPALYRTDLEVIDGNRRLMANPTFDCVPYRAQVQRLQKSGIDEAVRARTHTIVFPPSYWVIEPGDIGSWTSVRNGYSNKLFRVDAVTDKANLDVIANVTEVDPSDYSWNHPIDFQSVTIGPNVFPRPPAQGVKDWAATGTYLIDGNGITRRPAIRITWDGTLPGIIGIQYEIRLNLDLSDVAKGRSDQYEAGALIITQGLVGLTTYQIRGQYIPSSPRDMLWSAWITVVTPDVTLSIADFDAALKAQVTTITDAMNDKIDFLTQQIASLASNDMATNWLDKKIVRDEVAAVAGKASASILEVKTAQVSSNAAFASYQLTVSASIDSVHSSVTTNATAIAELNGFAAAEYAVTLDVNGYASGFNLLNGGPGFSTFTIVADKFQIQLPGYNGSAPYAFFTTGTVNGTPSVGINGNMYLDGTLFARSIVAGDITSVQIAAQTITSASGVIGNLGVKTLSIADNAVTVPVVQTLSSSILATSVITVNTVTLAVDTTGLPVNTPISVIASWVGSVGHSSGADTTSAAMDINGTTAASITSINSSDYFLGLCGSVSFLSNNSVQNITVNVNYSSNNTAVLVNRTLWAMAAKR
jgi:hypothetical protein